MTKSKTKSWLKFLLGGVLLLVLLTAAGWLETRVAGMQSGADVSGIGGPFTARDQKGHVITDKTILGKPSLIFFGYTFCPDECPTTLMDMSHWLKQLGPDAARLNVLFVTVDPQRDTPQHMAEYLTSFDPQIIGVIPETNAELKQITDDYHVYYKKTGSGDDYEIDHSAGIYLMDAQGKFVSMIDGDENRAQAFEKVKMLLK